MGAHERWPYLPCSGPCAEVPPPGSRTLEDTWPWEATGATLVGGVGLGVVRQGIHRWQGGFPWA